MSRNKYQVVSGVVFALVACLHLARVIYGWQVHIETWTAPLWLSWGGFVVAGALSIWAFRLLGRT